MNSPENHTISRSALRFLKWFCPDHLYEAIEGDLIQKFHRDVKEFGEARAKRRMVWNVIRFFRPGIILRNKFTLEPNQFSMFQNYLKTTFRHLLKSKVNFIFKLGGLTLALFSFLIIALYVSFQLSFDRYHDDFEKIFRVNSERRENGNQEKYGIVPLALGPMLQDRFPEIAAYTRLQIGNGTHIKYGQKVVYCGVFHADSSLFDVFTFKFIKGGKNALRKPSSIVISKTLAAKTFGNEDPLHKIITISKDNKLYEVTAVVENMRPNSHFVLDAFIPITDEHKFSMNEILSPVNFIDHASALYLRFHENADAAGFASKLESLLDEHVNKNDREESGYRIFLQPIKDIYLDSSVKYEFARKGSTLYLYIFLLLGFFLLAVASINYINLCIADFSTRSKEIGVRKVIGARKAQIFKQVILEAVFYCLASLLLALVLLYALFPKVLEVLDSNLQLISLAEPQLIVAIAATLLVLIVSATTLPAYRLATSNTINDLKGVPGQGRHSRLSSSLLIVQFIISILCISATLTVGRQLNYIHHKDLGFDRKNLLVLSMPEEFSVLKLRSFKQELKTIRGVAGVSNSSFRIGGGFWKDWYSVEIEGEMKEVELYEVFSDDDLFGTLGMRLLEGRFFDANMPADSGAAFVINETAVREFRWKDPVGKRILTHPEEKGKWDGTVVGVVSDINISTLHEKVQPLVMRLPWQSNYPEYFVYVRINGPSAEVIEAITKKHREILPGYPVELEFVDDFYNNQYQKENKAFESLRFGVVIIVLVASMGIFSLSIYMSARRMREFGIRKVLGATVRQIASLHIAYFLRIVLLANVLTLPVAYWLMRGWLDEFAYRSELSGLEFLAVALTSILLVIISSGYSAWKAGRMNPVDVIKMQ